MKKLNSTKSSFQIQFSPRFWTIHVEIWKLHDLKTIMLKEDRNRVFFKKSV